MSKKMKRYLMLIAAIGLLAVGMGGSGGTFASFNAEVKNPGNVFATGTLFLHGQKQNGNICRSEANSTNVNATCEVLLNSLGHKAGDSDSANIVLTNAGSLNASDIIFTTTCDDSTPPTIATAATYASGTYVTATPLTLTLTGLAQPLAQGTVLTISDGTHTDTMTVKTTVSSGSGTVDVTGTSAAGMTSTANISLATTFGSGALCNASTGVQFYVQETDNTWTNPEECIYPSAAGVTCDWSKTLGNSVAASPFTMVNFWSGAGAGTILDAGKSRYFTIGVKMPAALTNTAQNSQAKFDITWHIDQ